jgi:hypothetical protein
MSADIKYCYQDESVDDLARNMEKLQLKRLPVLNRQKRLVDRLARRLGHGVRGEGPRTSGSFGHLTAQLTAKAETGASRQTRSRRARRLSFTGDQGTNAGTARFGAGPVRSD